jgi:hypothetical protein
MEAGFCVLPLTGKINGAFLKKMKRVLKFKKKPGERINQPVTRPSQQQPVLPRDSSLQLLHSS